MGQPISLSHTVDGAGLPALAYYPEGASQSFLRGAPLQLSGGYLIECTFLAAQTVVGFAESDANNLTVAGTPEHLSIGAAQNQTSSKIIPAGAPPQNPDGMFPFAPANGKNIFAAQVKSGQTPAATHIISGTAYGLEKQSDGHWEVDLTDTTGDNAVAELVGIDSEDPDNRIVYFIVTSSLRHYA